MFHHTPSHAICLIVACCPPAMAFDTVINLPPGPSPTSIGSDTQLNLSSGWFLPSDFEAGSSDGSSSNVEVNISGGNVGARFKANGGSTVNVTGGTIAISFDARTGSRVNITDGNFFEGFFNARNDSQVTIAGGSLGLAFTAWDGSHVRIAGGEFGNGFSARSGSTIEIAGGLFGDSFQAFSDSDVRLIGGDFKIDGVPLEGLAIGQAVEVTQRNAVLTGVLSNGDEFAFDLTTPLPFDGRDYFSTGVLLSVTRSSFLTGDYNNDGAVDAADYTVWRDHLGGPAGALLNDPTGQAIGAAQHAAWQANYGSLASPSADAIPEPNALWMSGAGLVFAASVRSRIKAAVI